MTSEKWAGRPWPAVWRMALIASLGLNLFFAGWLLGGQFGSRGLREPLPPPLPPLHLMAHRLRGTLSADGARRMEALIQELDGGFTRNLRATGALREKVKAALAADPFDADALTKALDDMAAVNLKGRAEIHQRIAEAIAQLSPADRKRLVEITLEFPLPPGRPGPTPPR